MENSKIEWTDHTLNLWWGCQKVHAGCKNCYAETLDNRYNHENPHWGPGSTRKVVVSAWKNLDKFQRDAEKEGVLKTVFVGSMMDIFEDPLQMTDNDNQPITSLTTNGDKVPVTTGQLRGLLFDLITRGKYPNLIFLLLTKRPENINKYIPEAWKINPPENVMFGTSVVNQETAKELVISLLQVKGKKFLSCEPLIGAIDLTKLRDFIYSGYSVTTNALTGRVSEWDANGKDGQYDHGSEIHEKIDWVICGGESGDKARPMHPDWARKLRDDCLSAGTPYFFKQWGEWHPFYDRDIDDPDWRNIPSETKSCTRINLAGGHGFHGDRVIYFKKVGKGNAGALLDGKEYKFLPKFFNHA